MHPALLDDKRKQAADLADLAHLARLDCPTAVLALGRGGRITAAVAETIAGLLDGDRANAGPSSERRELTESLLWALMAPGQPDQLTEGQRGAFINVRGDMALDVSLADLDADPKIIPVGLPAGSPPQLPAADGQTPAASNGEAVAPANGQAARAANGQALASVDGEALVVADGEAPAAANGQALAAVDGEAPAAANGEPAGPSGLVIVGGAAKIAKERPYLSIEALMAYARRTICTYRSPAGEPLVEGGLEAARNLEIVVLLDSAVGGGLWIDVDPTTGRAAAALAIGLTEPRAGLRFTHVQKLRAPKLRTPLPAPLVTA